MDYKKQLHALETNYQNLVDKFVVAYPNLVNAAAFQLGNLFNRSEYPEADTIAKKFKFSVNYLPVPMAGDFRIDIEDYIKSEIHQSCQALYEERLNNAMKDAWARLHDCLTRMSDRLAVDLVDADEDEDRGKMIKPRVFRDSLLENAVELVNLLKHFNLTGDPAMEQARRELSTAITNHDATELREDMLAREAVKNKVDAILGKFSF
jgi:hypothetical protein